MNNIQTFLHMGGYAPFVWSSYGAMFAVFALNIILPIKRARRIRTNLRSIS